MRSGKLRHRVTLQQLVDNSPGHDTGGGLTQTWTDVSTVWASVEPLKGREFIAAQAVNAEVTGLIKMRYLAGVNERMRVTHGSDTYDILAVVDVEKRHEQLWLYVRSAVNDG